MSAVYGSVIVSSVTARSPENPPNISSSPHYNFNNKNTLAARRPKTAGLEDELFPRAEQKTCPPLYRRAGDRSNDTTSSEIELFLTSSRIDGQSRESARPSSHPGFDVRGWIFRKPATLVRSKVCKDGQKSKMQTFLELAASRRQWIEETLMPWCQQACRAELRRAELEWTDLAGRPDPAKTLWFWAWSRFPELVSADLSTLNETLLVRIRLHDGRCVEGFPDARESLAGQLVLLDDRGVLQGPYSIDEIRCVERL
jgi:hypothetical protein